MKNWIRGVNLGGWLVLERFITPYLFAITSCHLAGNFCYYPGQIGAPSVESDDYVLCPSVKECKPILQKNPRTGKQDYPVDEYSLVQAFGENHLALSSYLQHHYDTFITRQDIVALAHAGVTHVRVPMPHWILLKNEDSNDDEEYPWIVDNAMWLHFVRLVDWCREYGIEVWPDLHTAPGSQNGFDNSGRLNGEGATCDGWNDSPTNINRTLEALQKICVEIHNDGLRDVVTGISVLNEPYMDCDEAIVREYNKKALNIVRNVLGNTTAVVIGDMFNATLWDNGFWQNTPHTYLDSHYYHVFAENTRALSPKQHVALTCRKNARDVNDCCHDANSTTKKPASGISRLVGEWSAAYDTLPVNMLDEVMQGILEDGKAPSLDRNLTQATRDFLKHFVEAQMVVYESNSTGVSSGWFYWNVKMEGGVFAEWDFLRGIREKWIPTLSARNVSSASVFGTCEEILAKTDDDESIVHEYPDPKHSTTWKGTPLDDDLVISHGDKLDKEEEGEEDETVYTLEPPALTKKETEKPNGEEDDGDENGSDEVAPSTSPTSSGKAGTTTKEKKGGHGFVTLVFIGFFAYAIKRVFFGSEDRRRGLGYSSVHGSSSGEAVTMAV